jgi:hypothetical protein
MYFVQSFDYGGSSYVKIHAMTTDLLKATELYEKMEANWKDYNKKHESTGIAYLIYLLEILDEFVEFDEEKSADIFLGDADDRRDANINIIRSNNIPFLF